jgi:hypothetical protein
MINRHVAHVPIHTNHTLNISFISIIFIWLGYQATKPELLKFMLKLQS